MISACRSCKLSRTRLCIVKPWGLAPADALFIVEAPTESDERMKQLGRTPQARILGAMVEHAADMLGIDMPKYQIIPMVSCRPTDDRGGQDRAPARDEILACVPNVLSAVQACNPSAIFFLGDAVAKFWAKEFPEGRTLMPLWLLEKQGGSGSPHFTTTVRAIAEGLTHV